MRHAGIVLAAGASSRMGSPKALLKLPDGRALALAQRDLLETAGCERVIVVLGCDADSICRELPGCKLAVNAGWRDGRLGSVQAGLRAAPGFDGYVILPVDTVGVKGSTLAAMMAPASSGALRPFHEGKPGRLVWISCKTASAIMACAEPASRLDTQLAAIESRLDVDDPAVLCNLNTPEEWRRWLISVGNSGNE